MTTTGTLPAPGTAEGRAALEQEARGHGYPDAAAYTAAYAAGRVDTRGVGDRPGDPRTGFGQIQAYAKVAAIWGILLVEYAALSPAEPTVTGAAPPGGAPPPEDPDDAEDTDADPAPRQQDTDLPDRTPEPVAPRADTTFESVAATVAVVDMADGEAFDGIHSLDLVTPPDPVEHRAESTEPDGEPSREPESATATKDLAFGTVLPDAPDDQPLEHAVTDGPVFGAGFPLVAGELGDPGEAGDAGPLVDLPAGGPADPAEAFGTGTADQPPAAEALPDVGDEVAPTDDSTDPGPDPADQAGEDDADDYADLGDHVPALDPQDDPGDHTADDHHDAPDPAHDGPAAHDSGGESFT